MIYLTMCLLSVLSRTFEFGVIIPNESNEVQTDLPSLEFAMNCD